MSELENLLNPKKTTNVRWDLPESTMEIIKGYQKQMWAATGKYPTLPQIIVHMIEYVGKDACDEYFEGIAERKQQETKAQAKKKDVKPDANRTLAEMMIKKIEEKNEERNRKRMEDLEAEKAKS